MFDFTFNNKCCVKTIMTMNQQASSVKHILSIIEEHTKITRKVRERELYVYIRIRISISVFS